MGHTAGNWVVEIVRGSYKQPALVKSGDKVIAHCMGDQLDPQGTSIGEAKANAKLIASAPELLEVLKLMIPLHDSMGNTAIADKARAAVAKAEQ